MTAARGSSPLKIAALLLTLAWLIYIGLQAWHRWPVVPLDMGTSDAASWDIYRDAVRAHALRALLLAVAIPAIIWGLVALLRHRTGR